MFEKERAKQLTAELRKLTEGMRKVAEDELSLYEQVGGVAAATPDSVQALATRMQLIQLQSVVFRFGEILAEMLIDQAEAKDLGLEP